MSWIKTVDRMIAVGTPIIVVDSADHPHTRSELCKQIKIRGEKNGGPRPVVAYNIAAGFLGLNDPGKELLSQVDQGKLKAAAQGPHVALTVALDFPEKTVIIMDNLHWHWSQAAVMQALQNVREPFKASKRVVIALTNGGTLPTDLQQDCSYVEDPLPDETILSDRVCSIYRSALGPDAELDGEEALGLARELRGSSPFKAEQLAALSLTKEGFDPSKLRDNARKQINDTPGLSVESTDLTFDDIGGLRAIQEFMERYFQGPRRPTVVVRIEEIEKAMAGVETESSGTAGDALGTFLTAMEDNRWQGLLAHGISGTGKSLVAKATANQFGAKAVRFDINACRGSLVGESEKQIRQAVNILHAIGGDRVFFIASMNKIQSLPPELRRRFAAGTWFFDVPSEESRQNIWNICARQFGVEYDGYDRAQLTGSDIRDIVQRSYELSCSTTEASKYHVPLCSAAPDAIQEARSEAENRYLDADKGGPYRSASATSESSERHIEV